MTIAATATATARRFALAVNALARRGGAGETGLSDLLFLNAVHTAADTLIAVALANTLFFSVPTGQARGKVALYLAVTMAPFALVAPVVGPLLDRVRRGRRIAIALTLVVPGVLAWVMAGSAGGLELFPSAFGVLVVSKAYGVTRSAMVPRLLPDGVSLVSANARLSLSGTIATVVAAPVGAGISALLDYRWVLRVAVLVFLGGAMLAARLPARVDVAKDSGKAESGRIGRRVVDPTVVTALRAAAALRGLAGFVTLFFAFLLRADGAGTLGLAGLAVAYGVGNFLGNAAGTRLPNRAPQVFLLATLSVATVVCTIGAITYTTAVAFGVAFVAAASSNIAKLALDALIQQRTAEHVRASAFARSETVLQLAWVLGGAIGIAPVDGTAGLAIAGAAMLAALVTSVRGLRAGSHGPAAVEPAG